MKRGKCALNWIISGGWLWKKNKSIFLKDRPSHFRLYVKKLNICNLSFEVSLLCSCFVLPQSGLPSSHQCLRKGSPKTMTSPPQDLVTMSRLPGSLRSTIPWGSVMLEAGRRDPGWLWRLRWGTSCVIR